MSGLEHLDRSRITTVHINCIFNLPNTREGCFVLGACFLGGILGGVCLINDINIFSFLYKSQPEKTKPEVVEAVTTDSVSESYYFPDAPVKTQPEIAKASSTDSVSKNFHVPDDEEISQIRQFTK